MLHPASPHPFAGSPDKQASSLAKAGAWMQLAFVIGVLGTVFGMVRAFRNLGTEGVGDPSVLSAAIGEVLISTAVGSTISLIGCVLLGIAIFSQGNQPSWVKIVFGVSLLPVVSTVPMLVVNLIRAGLTQGT